MKPPRLFSNLLLLLFVLVPLPAVANTIPHRITVADFSYKNTDFASAMVLDLNTNKVLFEYNADQEWVPASLSKLISALVFVERQPAWDAIVSLQAVDEVGGGRLRVDEGATMSIQDLMYSSITGSANNAATAFGRLSGLGTEKFVATMNSRAMSLGCTASRFDDASGMATTSRTTAREMSVIAKAAFAQPRIKNPAGTIKYSFIVRNTGEIKTITNTNQLLIDPHNKLWVTAGKTGFLYESLHNLVYQVRPAQNDNRELLIIVLGAPTRADLFAVSERLAKWSWGAYSWRNDPPSSVISEAASIPNGTLVKKSDSPAVWYVWKGKKYVLLDGVFLDHYFPQTPIKIVSADIIEALESARPYTFDDGELLKSPTSPVVFYVERGSLRPISSEAAFLSMGWKWSEIITAPEWLLNTYSQGLAINTQNTDTVLLTSR
jgi:D-alanyl-D-alanine carboxypeptidase